MYCSKCGADNKEGSGFCSACGSPLKVVTENSAPVKKKSKKPLIIVIALLVIALAIVAVMFLLPQENAAEVYVPESCTLFYFDDGFPDGSAKIEFTYNADGTLKQYVAIYDEDYTDNGYSRTETGEFSYDRDERTITVTMTIVITETGEIVDTDKFCINYNSLGQITGYSTGEFKFVSEYDDEGNLIGKIAHYNDKVSYDIRFAYEKNMGTSRLQYIIMDEFTHLKCTYSNDGNTMEVRSSERPDELTAIYNYQTIKCTSDIDMESFMIFFFPFSLGW